MDFEKFIPKKKIWKKKRIHWKVIIDSRSRDSISRISFLSYMSHAIFSFHVQFYSFSLNQSHIARNRMERWHLTEKRQWMMKVCVIRFTFCNENAYQKCISHCWGKFFLSFALFFFLSFWCCFVFLNDSSCDSVLFLACVCISSDRFAYLPSAFLGCILLSHFHYDFIFIYLFSFVFVTLYCCANPFLFFSWLFLAHELSYLFTICWWKYPL